MTGPSGSGESEPESSNAPVPKDALARVLDAHLADRTRLSRFLHDEIAQFLSGIGLQLDILRMDFEHTVPGIAGRTTEIQEVLEQLVQRVRDFSYGLDPATVERSGLMPALDRLVGQYRRLFNGSLRLLASQPVAITGSAAQAVYRITDLALDNAVRHSKATKIEISIRLSRKHPEIEVRDNGAGFDLDAIGEKSEGLGLLLMRRSAEREGLDLTLRTAPGSGTSVSIRLPGQT